MEARLACILTLPFVLAACTATENTYATDTAAVAGYNLKLQAKEGKCLLAFEEEGKEVSVPLSVSPPCFFSRLGDGEIQSYAYDDVNVIASIIVIGNSITEETRQEWNIEIDAICGEKGQGIVIRKDGLKVTEKVLEGGVLCRTKGIDEKNFWYISH